jgi:alkanesulfonate monooxygenase SsuD/methylene tetrahydromethanopterin reductase-like flavin-dependent oxidoreductase (luciferase family)
MRGMLDGTRPTAAGEAYAARDVLNLPPPVQAHLPLLIGGGGARVTLRLVARYADACNLGGGVATVAEKERLLLQHCEAVGRDERELERTVSMGVPIIRDSRDEAERVFAGVFARNGGARLWQEQPVGTPEDVVAMCAPYVGMGYRHLIFGFPAPYDEETMTRLATEVRPRLEALLPG